jgi:hypothetical protein
MPVDQVLRRIEKGIARIGADTAICHSRENVGWKVIVNQTTVAIIALR